MFKNVYLLHSPDSMPTIKDYMDRTKELPFNEVKQIISLHSIIVVQY